MIQLTTVTPQFVNPGEDVIFDSVPLHTGNGEHYRNGATAVKLRASAGIYQIHFNASISVNASDRGAARLCLMAGDYRIPGSCITCEASFGVNTVSVSVPFCNDCADRNCISIRNDGAVPILILEDANLYIRRLS